ncbi:unnamed protein product [Heterotrigona itama]|uniref:Uncharacterized protein n=1 Tax=Heterotrigona itama TaxID=395501 RepID=A0A6V7H9S1_9HYME|nr:unnamed protein product [Heterotrigona itama]
MIASHCQSISGKWYVNQSVKVVCKLGVSEASRDVLSSLGLRPSGPDRLAQSLVACLLFACPTCWKFNLKNRQWYKWSMPPASDFTLQFFEFSIAVAVADRSRVGTETDVHKDSSVDLSFSGHRARRKEEARQTAIEEGCNKWLIILWMGNPSKA